VMVNYLEKTPWHSVSRREYKSVDLRKIGSSVVRLAWSWTSGAACLDQDSI
jgi:hypothetical protein